MWIALFCDIFSFSFFSLIFNIEFSITIVAFFLQITNIIYLAIHLSIYLPIYYQVLDIFHRLYISRLTHLPIYQQHTHIFPRNINAAKKQI